MTRNRFFCPDERPEPEEEIMMIDQPIPLSLDHVEAIKHHLNEIQNILKNYEAKK